MNEFKQEIANLFDCNVYDTDNNTYANLKIDDYAVFKFTKKEDIIKAEIVENGKIRKNCILSLNKNDYFYLNTDFFITLAFYIAHHYNIKYNTIYFAGIYPEIKRDIVNYLFDVDLIDSTREIFEAIREEEKNEF